MVCHWLSLETMNGTIHPLKRAHWPKNRKFRTIKFLSPRDPTSSTKVASSDPDNYKEPRTELKRTQTQRQTCSGGTVSCGQKISWHSGGRAPIRKDKCVCLHFPEPRTLKATHRKCDSHSKSERGHIAGSGTNRGSLLGRQSGLTCFEI